MPDRYVHDGVEYWKDLGRDVARECLETLQSMEGLSVGAVYARAAPSKFHHVKRQLYTALVDRLESELHDADELALIFMDGDGTDTSYRSTHRGLKLNARRVIEDAIHIDSSQSQLVQMADLVEWSAYAAIERYAGHAFAWDWYHDYLSVRDPARMPQRIDL